MKRILNLNDFSGQALKLILLVGLMLPTVLFLLERGLDQIGLRLPLLGRMGWFFLVVGGVLLLLFFALVVAEQIQDNILYRRYLRERGKQVEDECPFCGNRSIRPFEHVCPVCGEGLHRKV